MPVILVKPRRFGDSRGWFSETYRDDRYVALGVDSGFVQDNQSWSAAAGTVRGLHFQRPPHAQAKLVRCLVGAIWDVAVDLRRGSPTYGGWVGAELTAENGHQLYVPVGFAHGFVTLTDDTHVAYKVSDFYAPETEGGLIWNDPALALAWPLPAGGAVTSDKDAVLGGLDGFKTPFDYDGKPLVALGDGATMGGFA